MVKLIKKFSDIQKEESLRLDVKYHFFQYSKNYYTFEDLFIIKDKQELTNNDIEGDFLYSEIRNTDSLGTVFPQLVNLEDENHVTDDLVKKINKGDIQKVTLNSILIPRVRPNLGKFILVNKKYSDILFTKAFIEISSKSFDNELILYYLLKSYLKDNLLSVCRIGKGYPTINENDLKKIRFSRELVDSIISDRDLKEELKKLHANIQVLIEKKNACHIDSIINNSFQKFFNYNFEMFENLKSNHVQTKKFSAFANNIDLRFSSKFHRIAGEFVYSELIKNSNKIKNVLESVSITGKGISPKDYDDETGCYYITMANISTWELDYDNLKTVSKDYEKKNSSKKPKGEKNIISTKVKSGDILMMRSGEGGIGKVALVTKEINAIFSDFLILFRFDKSKYISQFCYYYMRSKYFQYLIEINKKGLGNNTNIFPNNTNEFPIPNISLDEQRKIVLEIEKEIREQKKIEEEIEKLQKQIFSILEKNL